MTSNLDINNSILDKDKKIGIMGGTFDPIHFGHLFIAQTALDKFTLDNILFIPAGNPPHKNKNMITDKYIRMDMVNLAIESNTKFQTSAIEIFKENTTYTIDTIKELQQLYNNRADFYFITGTDAFIQLDTWKEYIQLLSITKFIVMTRQVENSKILDEKIELFTKEYEGHIYKVEIPTLDISSTDIRKRVKESNSIKYLLPDSVEKYILNNDLYI